MGRVKSKAIKRDGMKLFEMGRDVFTESFEENKKLLERFAEFRSKKLRNVIAGYITKLVKEKNREFNNTY